MMTMRKTQKILFVENIFLVFNSISIKDILFLFFIQQLDLFGFIFISTLKIKSPKFSECVKNISKISFSLSLGLTKFKLSVLIPSSKSHPCTLYWTMSQVLLRFESLLIKVTWYHQVPQVS